MQGTSIMSVDFQIDPEDILIRAQDTPNPNAIKFIVNFPLKEVGNATFKSAEECGHLPLAKSLFDIPGVEQVYFFQNTVTLTHTEELPVDIVKEQVKSIIKTRLAVHDPEFIFEGEEKARVVKDRSQLSPEMQKIEEILDRTIRPGLQADGGDIEVLEFKDNELSILYQGACGGCPSAMMGTLDAIQSILRNEMDNDQLMVVPI